MLVIGERINATRKFIREALEKRDIGFIQKEVVIQVESGANLIDVNCGSNPDAEMKNIEWLIKTVQEVTDVPLVTDSSNPGVIEIGLKAYVNKSNTGRAMVNSITAEKEKIERILPLVKKYNTDIIALTIEGKGMPENAQERFDIAQQIFNIATKDYGISAGNIYFDLLVRPVSTEPGQVKEFLKAIILVKQSLGAKTVCGLSNISFGLPSRSLLNSTFLAMCISAGLDAAIIDPTDKNLMAVLRAGESLIGKDEYCMNYIASHREGKL